LREHVGKRVLAGEEHRAEVDPQHFFPVVEAGRHNVAIDTEAGVVDQDVDAPRVPAFGRTADQRSFGHNGAGCTIGFAGLDRGLGVAYLTNGNRRLAASMERTGAVADAIRAAVI
jgi:hypothetical protein